MFINITLIIIRIIFFFIIIRGINWNIGSVQFMLFDCLVEVEVNFLFLFWEIKFCCCKRWWFILMIVNLVQVLIDKRLRILVWIFSLIFNLHFTDVVDEIRLNIRKDNVDKWGRVFVSQIHQSYEFKSSSTWIWYCLKEFNSSDISLEVARSGKSLIW